jgi:hypothetical protein
MIGKNIGMSALFLLKYYCIIHQESLCGKSLNHSYTRIKFCHAQHLSFILYYFVPVFFIFCYVMDTVVKCVNKIRAHGLFHQEF